MRQAVRFRALGTGDAMGHIRILAALALALAAGQASAQDVVEPAVEDFAAGDVVVAGAPEAPVEAVAEDEALAGDDDGVLPGDDVAADDPGAPVEEGEAVAEDEAQAGDDFVADGTDEPAEEPLDNRSARGMERAADGAQVSRMARASSSRKTVISTDSAGSGRAASRDAPQSSVSSGAWSTSMRPPMRVTRLALWSR